MKSRREGRTDAAAALIGLTGTVTREISPRGIVRVASETWTAISEDGTVIKAGGSVKVTGVDGLILSVSAEEPLSREKAVSGEKPPDPSMGR